MIGKGNKHENYEILNLLGYGLAKFNDSFIKQFGFNTKNSFYEYIVEIDISKTTGTVKNRQDLFDPFFENGRKGWWQKGNAYIHRKYLIDGLFGNLNVYEYSKVVKLYLNEYFNIEIDAEVKQTISPIVKSRFKQLQITGQEAEIYFLNNYNSISLFENGIIEDARLFGDGYDFQIEVSPLYFLAEVKGIRSNSGSIRLTQKEFSKAKEYKNKFVLSIVYNLDDIPKISIIENPIKNLAFTKKELVNKQINYHSEFLKW